MSCSRRTFLGDNIGMSNINWDDPELKQFRDINIAPHIFIMLWIRYLRGFADKESTLKRLFSNDEKISAGKFIGWYRLLANFPTLIDEDKLGDLFGKLFERLAKEDHETYYEMSSVIGQSRSMTSFVYILDQ